MRLNELRMKKMYFSIIAAFLISGCTIVNSTALVVGEKRTPIDFQLVKIYTTAPNKYEEVAIIQAEAGHDFKSAQSVMDSAVMELKKEAAKVGANGVLLGSIGRRDGNNVGLITSLGPNVGTGIAVMTKGRGYQTISGTAIFVKE